MHSLAKQLSLAFLTLLLVLGYESAYAIESFKTIHTGEISEIKNEHLFFARSNHGFVSNNKSGSPLQSEIPKEINVLFESNKHQSSQATVLVQKIQTKEQKPRTLEGGVPGERLLGGYFIYIIGGVLGLIIAPFLRQEPLLGALVGAIALPLILSSMFTSEDFEFHIDNATDENLNLIIDSFPPIQISGHSQLTLKVKEKIHDIKVAKISDGSTIEQFKLQAKDYLDESRKKISGQYVYNIVGANSYEVHNVVYSPN